MVCAWRWQDQSRFENPAGRRGSWLRSQYRGHRTPWRALSRAFEVGASAWLRGSLSRTEAAAKQGVSNAAAPQCRFWQAQGQLSDPEADPSRNPASADSWATSILSTAESITGNGEAALRAARIAIVLFIDELQYVPLRLNSAGKADRRPPSRSPPIAATDGRCRLSRISEVSSGPPNPSAERLVRARP
jgi:hypothetical protein